MGLVKVVMCCIYILRSAYYIHIGCTYCTVLYCIYSVDMDIGLWMDMDMYMYLSSQEAMIRSRSEHIRSPVSSVIEWKVHAHTSTL